MSPKLVPSIASRLDLRAWLEIVAEKPVGNAPAELFKDLGWEWEWWVTTSA